MPSNTVAVTDPQILAIITLAETLAVDILMGILKRKAEASGKTMEELLDLADANWKAAEQGADDLITQE